MLLRARMQDWIMLDQSEMLAQLNVTEQGLTTTEASERRKRYGNNEIVRKKRRSIVLEAISHSTNPLVAILLIAAIVSALTGSVASAVIIISIIVFSVGLDYVQSHRAQVAVKSLQAKIAVTASVLRDRQWIEIPYRELVPGDIIHLVAGDMVPADALLLKSKDLHVQQSALTGESLPVEKEAIKPNVMPKNPAEAINAVFSGSSVISGTATGIVVNTGNDTEFGHIAEMLLEKAPRTEFEKGIVRFGAFIMKTVFFLVIFVFSVNMYFGHALLESLLFSVALAVGLTPELLPMITTVTLAAGAMHMSKKKVIVKNLSAIQNFGSIDILCSDKTGTLTSGNMKLEQVIDSQGKKSEHVMLLAYLNSLFMTEMTNPFNAAVLKTANINPLDAAILNHDHPLAKGYKKIDEIPFDFERRRSSIVVEKEEKHLLIAKGAPEHIISACTHYENDDQEQVLTDEIRKQCKSLFLSLSNQGYRVIAIAYRTMHSQSTYTSADEKDLVLGGFLAFLDPPLPDSSAMIHALKKEGVHIKILTGDNDLVTRHICSQVGLDSHQIIMGDDMDHISDLALGQIAENTSIFARISPAQKQRIIQALRSRGHVVGFLGDGINDAPSLHTADVGISVAGAVDVAREAADIILLERHLRVLLSGIIEGRKSFGNVMKYLMMGTSSNFGNMLSMAAAVLFLPFLPMLPVQLLLNNLLYDISQVTIPTDNVDPSFIKKSRRWNIDIIRKFMFYIGPISSLFDFLTFFVLLKVFSATESFFQTGWFVESLATQTLVIFVIRTAKSPWKSRPSFSLTAMVLGMVCLGILLPFSPVAHFFKFTALPPMYFLFLFIATLSYLLLVELIKKKLMWRWIEQ